LGGSDKVGMANLVLVLLCEKFNRELKIFLIALCKTGASSYRDNEVIKETSDIDDIIPPRTYEYEFLDNIFTKITKDSTSRIKQICRIEFDDYGRVRHLILGNSTYDERHFFYDDKDRLIRWKMLSGFPIAHISIQDTIEIKMKNNNSLYKRSYSLDYYDNGLPKSQFKYKPLFKGNESLSESREFEYEFFIDAKERINVIINEKHGLGDTKLYYNLYEYLYVFDSKHNWIFYNQKDLKKDKIILTRGRNIFYKD
ncbi:MAG: hypothetical protein AAF806_07625, partial [Bacteroidota bacterium]